MDPTWRTLHSETVLKDRWIDVRQDRCETPGGVEISPYYVLAYPDWVNVVALTPADELVLVRQYRHAVGRMVLELPGGVVDAADTDLEQAARRELREESGFVAGALRPLCSLFTNPATHTNRIHSFLALDAVPGPGQALDPGEEGMQVVTMKVDAVLDGIGRGVIGQAMHVGPIMAGLYASGRLRAP